MTDIVETWHAVWTYASAEKKAERAIREKNYATLLLLENVKRPFRRGRNRVAKWDVRPVYPRYVFFGVRPGQGLAGVRSAKGVSEILTMNERPLVIPHRVVDELFMKADADGFVGSRDLMKRREFAIGQLVEIDRASPFGGFVAEVSKDCGKEVAVWLEMLGARREVTLAPEHLRAVG